MNNYTVKMPYIGVVMITAESFVLLNKESQEFLIDGKSKLCLAGPEIDWNETEYDNKTPDFT
jgi:hypothetical protein